MKTVKRYHLCMSISGALKSGDWKLLAKYTTSNGMSVSDDEVFEELMRRLAAGEKAIPLGDCDNFDPQVGCLGHTEHDLRESGRQP